MEISKLQNLRLSALYQLKLQLDRYNRDCYHQRLLTGIAEKKCKMILEKTTKAEIRNILYPEEPRFDVNRFNSALTPEEELILWSKISLVAPIHQYCVKRYLALFFSIFPETEDEFNDMAGI